MLSSGSRVSRLVSRVGVLACGGILRIDERVLLNGSVKRHLHAHEHNLESPWPYDVNRGKSYI